MRQLIKQKWKQLQKNGAARWSVDILITMVGSFLFALGTHCFTAPNHMAPGGVTGLATIFNFLSGIPIGVLTILINIPILILGFWKVGRRYMIKTIVSLVSYSLFLDVVLVHIPVYTNDQMVACIFGGVTMGAGIGLVMSRGGSTGGMDIVNKLIQRRFPHLKLGEVQFTTDLVIVTLSIAAYGSIEPAFYALICLYITAVALDAVLYGMNVCKMIYIVSKQTDAICRRIHSELDRGATILKSYGSYTREERPTIMVAVRQTEYYRLRRIIREVDPDAFVIMTSASEIVGEGFEELV